MCICSLNGGRHGDWSEVGRYDIGAPTVDVNGYGELSWLPGVTLDDTLQSFLGISASLP